MIRVRVAIFIRQRGRHTKNDVIVKENTSSNICLLIQACKVIMLWPVDYRCNNCSVYIAFYAFCVDAILSTILYIALVIVISNT